MLSRLVVEIRRYTDADRAAAVRLHHEALATTGAHAGPGPWDDDLERIEEVYLRSGGEFLVATLDGELVAMGALRRIDERVAEIKRMRTAPAHQRRGLGRELLARLERRAAELGYEQLCLDTTDKQAAAQQLYESAGYHEVRRERRCWFELIFFEKSIGTERMSVHVVFETHSTSEDNERGLASGWRDVSLSAQGAEQARELGRRRTPEDFAAIYSSDLRRAVETVELAFPDAQVPTFRDSRLRECDYGRLSGRSDASVLGDWRRYLNAPYPGGESWTQAISRVQGYLRGLPARWAGKTVLIVGHRATRLALELMTNSNAPEVTLAQDHEWRPGWEYTIVRGQGG